MSLYLLCLQLSSQLFFPSEKGTVQTYGQYQVSVQSFTEKEGGLFSERLLSVSGSKVSPRLQFVASNPKELWLEFYHKSSGS